MSDKSIQEAALENYTNGEPWPEASPWYDTVKDRLGKATDYWIAQNITAKDKVLFAGCGLTRYESPAAYNIYMDIIARNVEMAEHHIVGSIEDIPLDDNSMDAVHCVGSVVNYVDIEKAVSEFSRVLKPGGKMLLEFENSRSFEFLTNGNYNKKSFEQTFYYNNQAHPQWTYGRSYVRNIVRSNNLIIKDTEYFHILSSFMLGLNMELEQAAYYAKYDKQLRFLSAISASNMILTLIKQK